MPKFAANLSWLFTELQFMDRFAAAAAVGFKGVECLFPYDHPAAHIKERLENHGLEMVLINAPPGDWEQGERGLGCLPERQEGFRRSFDQALDTAAKTNCPRIHVMSGIVPDDASPSQLRDVFVENLTVATEMCAGTGVQVMIEPLNPVDVPGYFLSLPGQAATIISQVARPNLELQFDIYHAAMSGLDVAAEIARHFPLIGHFQVAGMPGRREPVDGNLDCPALFGLIDRLSYEGWIGCEYRPLAGTEEGLEWVRQYGISRRAIS